MEDENKYCTRNVSEIDCTSSASDTIAMLFQLCAIIILGLAIVLLCIFITIGFVSSIERNKKAEEIQSKYTVTKSLNKLETLGIEEESSYL